MRIAVIGTGIVGACCAAWLQRDGHEIVFVDPEGNPLEDIHGVRKLMFVLKDGRVVADRR